jgi:3-oxoacyl-[acyl-carrier protein] reductase
MSAEQAMAEQTVVISGAGTGIGRAVARRLAVAGQHVTVTGRRDGPLRELAGEFGALVEPVTADAGTPDGAAAVAAAVADGGRGCAGLVCAAGGLSSGSSEAGPGLGGLDGTRADWQAAFESNVLTAVLLTEALRGALERASGRVVLLSSVAALRGSGGGPYGAMKAALHAWAFDLARELGPHGGTANVVAPGFVPDTEFWAGRLTPARRRERAAQNLVGREGTPQEVASLIAWLLGSDGGWVTGQIISPNGGAVLGR